MLWKKCGRGMLKLVSQRGYFLFTERQNLKIFRLRWAEAQKSEFIFVIRIFSEKLPPIRAANILRLKNRGYAKNFKINTGTDCDQCYETSNGNDQPKAEKN